MEEVFFVLGVVVLEGRLDHHEIHQSSDIETADPGEFGKENSEFGPVQSVVVVLIARREGSDAILHSGVEALGLLELAHPHGYFVQIQIPVVIGIPQIKQPIELSEFGIGGGPFGQILRLDPRKLQQQLRIDRGGRNDAQLLKALAIHKEVLHIVLRHVLFANGNCHGVANFVNRRGGGAGEPHVLEEFRKVLVFHAAVVVLFYHEEYVTLRSLHFAFVRESKDVLDNVPKGHPALLVVIQHVKDQHHSCFLHSPVEIFLGGLTIAHKEPDHFFQDSASAGVAKGNLTNQQLEQVVERRSRIVAVFSEESGKFLVAQSQLGVFSKELLVPFDQGNELVNDIQVLLLYLVEAVSKFRKIYSAAPIGVNAIE